MSTRRKITGDTGEKIAADFLAGNGYKILEKNFRCRYGEIDIIATKADRIVFFEVRTKKSLAYGMPEESITRAKQNKLIVTAQTYLKRYGDSMPDWRIDVIAIVMNSDDSIKSINLIEGAIV